MIFKKKQPKCWFCEYGTAGENGRVDWHFTPAIPLPVRKYNNIFICDYHKHLIFDLGNCPLLAFKKIAWQNAFRYYVLTGLTLMAKDHYIPKVHSKQTEKRAYLTNSEIERLIYDEDALPAVISKDLLDKVQKQFEKNTHTIIE